MNTTLDGRYIKDEEIYMDVTKMELTELEYRLLAARYLSNRYWRLWKAEEAAVAALQKEVDKRKVYTVDKCEGE